MKDTNMTFWEHLGELRKRLLISSAALLIGMIACFFFIEPVAAFIMRPVDGMQFVYLSPPELFMSYMKIALIDGIIVAPPSSSGFSSAPYFS